MEDGCICTVLGVIVPAQEIETGLIYKVGKAIVTVDEGYAAGDFLDGFYDDEFGETKTVGVKILSINKNAELFNGEALIGYVTARIMQEGHIEKKLPLDVNARLAFSEALETHFGITDTETAQECLVFDQLY